MLLDVVREFSSKDDVEMFQSRRVAETYEEVSIGRERIEPALGFALQDEFPRMDNDEGL
jgi:hypothetical protein